MAFDKELQQKYGFKVRDTAKGIWGTSNLDHVYSLFKKIKLENYSRFLDVGCGDGRVVLVASLFTDAAGVEFDSDLVAKALEIKKKLGLTATITCGDFFEEDFSSYDIIFTNPDTGFYNGIEDKLLSEFKGKLIVYNNVFLPRLMKRGKTYWFDQVPVTEFSS